MTTSGGVADASGDDVDGLAVNEHVRRDCVPENVRAVAKLESGSLALALELVR
jgi:hypothetical protein